MKRPPIAMATPYGMVRRPEALRGASGRASAIRKLSATQETIEARPGINPISASTPPATEVTRIRVGKCVGPAHSASAASSLTSPPPIQPRENMKAPIRKVAPAIATLRPKTQEALAADPARHGEVIMLDHQTPTNSLRTRVIERRRNEEQGVRLDEAEIVVSGGRGLGGPDGFVVLEELACVLGGAVGASRPACDLGWYPQKHQVGISGKTVAPELYIAVGISGAGHHMAGCGRSKVLVAINNDPDAEVFSYAHIGIVADYRTLIPEIVDVLRR